MNFFDGNLLDRAAVYKHDDTFSGRISTTPLTVFLYTKLQYCLQLIFSLFEAWNFLFWHLNKKCVFLLNRRETQSENSTYIIDNYGFILLTFIYFLLLY